MIKRNKYNDVTIISTTQKVSGSIYNIQRRISIYKTHYGETIGVLQSNNQGDCKYDLSRINLNNFPNEDHVKYIQNS